MWPGHYKAIREMQSSRRVTAQVRRGRGSRHTPECSLKSSGNLTLPGTIAPPGKVGNDRLPFRGSAYQLLDLLFLGTAWVVALRPGGSLFAGRALHFLAFLRVGDLLCICHFVFSVLSESAAAFAQPVNLVRAKPFPAARISPPAFSSRSEEIVP